MNGPAFALTGCLENSSLSFCHLDLDPLLEAKTQIDVLLSSLTHLSPPCAETSLQTSVNRHLEAAYFTATSDWSKYQ